VTADSTDFQKVFITTSELDEHKPCPLPSTYALKVKSQGRIFPLHSTNGTSYYRVNLHQI